MTYVLMIVSIAQSVLLYLSVKKNLEWLQLLETASDEYKEILNELSAIYKSVDKKSKMELFLDEPVTRELVEDIKGTKKAIRLAAEKISVFIEEENDDEEKKS